MKKIISITLLLLVIRGGRIIAVGTPEQIAANPDSYTGQYLRQILK